MYALLDNEINTFVNSYQSFKNVRKHIYFMNISVLLGDNSKTTLVIEINA